MPKKFPNSTIIFFEHKCQKNQRKIEQWLEKKKLQTTNARGKGETPDKATQCKKTEEKSSESSKNDEKIGQVSKSEKLKLHKSEEKFRGKIKNDEKTNQFPTSIEKMMYRNEWSASSDNISKNTGPVQRSSSLNCLKNKPKKSKIMGQSINFMSFRKKSQKKQFFTTFHSSLRESFMRDINRKSSTPIICGHKLEKISNNEELSNEKLFEKSKNKVLPTENQIITSENPGTTNEAGFESRGTTNEAGFASPGTTKETGFASPGTTNETGFASPGTTIKTGFDSPGKMNETGFERKKVFEENSKHFAYFNVLSENRTGINRNSRTVEKTFLNEKKVWNSRNSQNCKNTTRKNFCRKKNNKITGKLPCSFDNYKHLCENCRFKKSDIYLERRNSDRKRTIFSCEHQQENSLSYENRKSFHYENRHNFNIRQLKNGSKCRALHNAHQKNSTKNRNHGFENSIALHNEYEKKPPSDHEIPLPNKGCNEFALHNWRNENGFTLQDVPKNTFIHAQETIHTRKKHEWLMSNKISYMKSFFGSVSWHLSSRSSAIALTSADRVQFFFDQLNANRSTSKQNLFDLNNLAENCEKFEKKFNKKENYEEIESKNFKENSDKSEKNCKKIENKLNNLKKEENFDKNLENSDDIKQLKEKLPKLENWNKNIYLSNNERKTFNFPLKSKKEENNESKYFFQNYQISKNNLRTSPKNTDSKKKTEPKIAELKKAELKMAELKKKSKSSWSLSDANPRNFFSKYRGKIKKIRNKENKKNLRSDADSKSLEVLEKNENHKIPDKPLGIATSFKDLTSKKDEYSTTNDEKVISVPKTTENSKTSENCYLKIFDEEDSKTLTPSSVLSLNNEEEEEMTENLSNKIEFRKCDKNIFSNSDLKETYQNSEFRNVFSDSISKNPNLVLTNLESGSRKARDWVKSFDDSMLELDKICNDKADLDQNCKIDHRIWQDTDLKTFKDETQTYLNEDNTICYKEEVITAMAPNICNKNQLYSTCTRNPLKYEEENFTNINGYAIGDIIENSFKKNNIQLENNNEPMYSEIKENYAPKPPPRRKRSSWSLSTNSDILPNCARSSCSSDFCFTPPSQRLSNNFQPNVGYKDQRRVPDWIQNRPPIPKPRLKRRRSTQSVAQNSLQYDFRVDSRPRSSLEPDFYSGKAASVSYGRSNGYNDDTFRFALNKDSCAKDQVNNRIVKNEANVETLKTKNKIFKKRPHFLKIDRKDANCDNENKMYLNKESNTCNGTREFRKQKSFSLENLTENELENLKFPIDKKSADDSTIHLSTSFSGKTIGISKKIIALKNKSSLLSFGKRKKIYNSLSNLIPGKTKAITHHPSSLMEETVSTAPNDLNITLQSNVWNFSRLLPQKMLNKSCSNAPSALSTPFGSIRSRNSSINCSTSSRKSTPICSPVLGSFPHPTFSMSLSNILHTKDLKSQRHFRPLEQIIYRNKLEKTSPGEEKSRSSIIETIKLNELNKKSNNRLELDCKFNEPPFYHTLRKTPRQRSKRFASPKLLFEYHLKNITEKAGQKSNRCGITAFGVEDLLCEALYSVSCLMGPDPASVWTITGFEKAKGNRAKLQVAQSNIHSYLKNVFQISDERFLEIFAEARKRELVNLCIFLKIIEAKNLRPKSVQGTCSPYALVKVSSSNDTLRTRTIKENLSPKWNQNFQLDLKNIQNDVVNLEIYHDLEPRVSGNVSKVKDLKAFSRLIKEKTAIVNNQQSLLLGKVSFDVKELVEVGIDKWLTIRKETTPKDDKIRGSVRISGFIGPKKVSTEITASRRTHDALLAYFSYHDLKTSNNNNKDEINFLLPWFGNLKPESTAVICQHAVVCGLSPAQHRLSTWLVGSRVPSADTNWQLELLEDVYKYSREGSYSIGDQSDLADSLSQWVDYALYRLRHLNKHFAVKSGVRAQYSLSSLLAITCLLDTREEFCSLLQQNNVTNVKEKVKESLLTYAKLWWSSVVEDYLICELAAEIQIERILSITLESQTFLQEISKFYSPTVKKEIDFDYFTEVFEMISRKLNACVRPALINVFNHYDDVQRLQRSYEKTNKNLNLQDGTSLWELYFSLGKINKLGRGLPKEAFESTGLYEYHNWFNRAVRRWVEVAQARALEMIEKAVNLDSFETVDEYHNFSSSATDLCGIFTDVQIWWKKLEWPDPENSMVLLAKILEDVCTYGVRYADLLKTKLETIYLLQNDTPNAVMFKQICVGLNNIEKIFDEILKLPKLFDIQSLLSQIRKNVESGLEVSERFDKNIEILVQSCADNVQEKNFDFIEIFIEKVHGELEASVIQCCENGSDEHLLSKTLDPTLHILRHSTSQKNFEQFLNRIWLDLLENFMRIVNLNAAKRPHTYFKNVYGILKSCLSFFTPIDGLGLSNLEAENQYYTELEALLRGLSLSSEELISSYYSTRFEQQISEQFEATAQLIVRAFFTTHDKLSIEVIMAKDFSVDPEPANLFAKSHHHTATNDPYIKIQLVPQENFSHFHEHRSKILKNSDPAVFEENFDIDLTPQDSGIINGYVLFTVKLYHLSRHNTFVGEAVLPLCDLPLVKSAKNSVPNTYLKVTQPSREDVYSCLQVLKLRSNEKVATHFIKKINSRLNSKSKGSSNSLPVDEQKISRSVTPKLLRKIRPS